MSELDAATYRYHKQWRYDRAHGRTRTTDATRARLHIATCLGAGMSMSALAAAAGVSVQVICRINQDQRAVRRDTEAKILSVAPGVTTAARPGQAEPFVPSIGTRRRIRALLAIGWRHADITAAAGTNSAVALHQQGRWVTLRKHEAFARAYRDLAGRPGPSEKSRRWAQKLGYPGPLDWDDIDHDTEPATTSTENRSRLFEEPDPVVIERILSGDWALATHANPLERRQIVATWTGRGQSLNELVRLTGWQVHRYTTRGAA